MQSERETGAAGATLAAATPAAATPGPDTATGAPPAARTRRGLRLAMLLGSDLAALLLAGAVAYLAWALPVRQQSPELYLSLAPLLVLFLCGYAQAGLYPGFGLGPVEMLRRLSYVTGFVYLMLASYSFVLKAPHLYSRVTFALAFGLSLFSVPLLRLATVRLGSRWEGWLEPVVLAGEPENLRALHQALATAHQLGYRPAALVTLAAGREAAALPDLPDLPLVRGLDGAAELARRGLRVILLAGDFDAGMLDRLHRSFRHVIALRGFGDLPVEGVQVRSFGGAVGIEYTNELLLTHNRWVKRSLDLLLAGFGALLSAPVVAAAAVAVKLTSRGPAFFVQRRAGLDGRPVDVPKIRTMHADAEARLEEHLAADPELRAEWDEHMKLRRDPRLIPVVGPLLRRFSLDELPQLWSVVQGDMSLVGPRPFPDYHLEMFPASFRELRQRVRPGITGLWQVTLRSEGSIAEQQAADSYYIRNWSLWLDLYVLARTLGAVLRGSGAY